MPAPSARTLIESEGAMLSSRPMKTPHFPFRHVTPFILGVAFSLGSLSVIAQAPAATDPAKLSAHVKTLASDAFEGRGPATPGEQKTVAYITEQMKAAGLQPGGDLKNGARAWTQDVPLAQVTIDGPIALSATAAGQTHA